MENFLPFTDDVMVVLVHKCVQQTHLLALHLETLGYIPRLLNALNGLVYFLIIGDPRGDNLMVGSISRKLLTELGIRTKSNFSDQFKEIVKCYIRIGCTLGVMRQSPCRVQNPITVYSYGFLFNFTTVGQASYSMTALTLSFNQWVGAWCLSVAGPTVAQLEVFFSSDYP